MQISSVLLVFLAAVANAAPVPQAAEARDPYYIPPPIKDPIGGGVAISPVAVPNPAGEFIFKRDEEKRDPYYIPPPIKDPIGGGVAISPVAVPNPAGEFIFKRKQDA